MKPFIKKIADEDIEFQNIINELITNPTVQEMKKYRQHYETTCFDHCYMAAYYCFLICKKYHLIIFQQREQQCYTTYFYMTGE